MIIKIQRYIVNKRKSENYQTYQNSHSSTFDLYFSKTKSYQKSCFNLSNNKQNLSPLIARPQITRKACDLGAGTSFSLSRIIICEERNDSPYYCISY